MQLALANMYLKIIDKTFVIEVQLEKWDMPLESVQKRVLCFKDTTSNAESAESPITVEVEHEDEMNNAMSPR